MPSVAKSTAIKVNTKTVKPVEITKIETKLVKFSHPNLKISPRKLRLLASDIKKYPLSQALINLQFTNTNASRIFLDILKNAIANAKKNHHLIADSLKFSEVRVDEGLKIKRMDKSHGSRFARGIRLKRHSRLLIILSGTIAS